MSESSRECYTLEIMEVNTHRRNVKAWMTHTIKTIKTELFANMGFYVGLTRPSRGKMLSTLPLGCPCF